MYVLHTHPIYWESIFISDSHVAPYYEIEIGKWVKIKACQNKYRILNKHFSNTFQFRNSLHPSTIVHFPMVEGQFLNFSHLHWLVYNQEIEFRLNPNNV
jgi:hypothetical protein